MDIIKLCEEKGASNASGIKTKDISFEPELIKLCEANACGRYGKVYTCPPHVGNTQELIDALMKYETAVIWQNIYPLEDSFDFEGMMEAQDKHVAMTHEIAGHVYKEFGRENVVVLAAGGCSVCDECAAATSKPCRFPERALSSLEAYGINVSELAKTAGMNYINGVNTVTYFSGAFYQN